NQKSSEVPAGGEANETLTRSMLALVTAPGWLSPASSLPRKYSMCAVISIHACSVQLSSQGERKHSPSSATANTTSSATLLNAGYKTRNLASGKPMVTHPPALQLAPLGHSIVIR